ncbi:hypothetical protein Tco_0421114 [Tanacetum coccineum]
MKLLSATSVKIDLKHIRLFKEEHSRETFGVRVSSAEPQHKSLATALPFPAQEKKLEGFLKRRNMVLSDSEEEESEAQGRKSQAQDDPLASLVQGMRRKRTKGKKVVSSLDFQEEVDTGAEEVNTAEGVNTGSIKLSTEEKLACEAIRLDTFTKEEVAKQEVTYKEKILQEDGDRVNQRKKIFCRGKSKSLKEIKPMTPITAEDFYDELFDRIEGGGKTPPMEVISAEDLTTKASLKRYGEELQTKTTKRLKNDEAKDDEPTKKSGKRRKQMARKGLHTDIDKDGFDDSDEVGKQEVSVSGKDRTVIVYMNFVAMLKDISKMIYELYGL